MNYKDITSIKASTVNDIGRYTTEMRKATIDKIFFLDKVDAGIFVDYGCADASVITLASQILPQACFIGYDNSAEMIEKAKESCPPTIHLFSDWKNTQRYIKLKKGHSGQVCVSLLSLIHEVYSYGPEKVKEFWSSIFNEKFFNYVAIRDMCVSRTTSRPSDPISVTKIRMKYDKEMLSQWEANWGSLNDNWSLVHFLLTYRYTQSWDREMHENYLPLPLEGLLSLIPQDWEPIYIEHYTLPFIRDTVYRDFDIDLQDKTHLKLILRRKSK